MSKIGVKTQAYKDAREYKEPGFQFTRRAIALASVGAIIVLPVLAGIFNPSLPISLGWEETKNGFLFFTDAAQRLTWATGTGIVLAPIHTHLIYAITGMYFGSSSVK
jgi:hypothetical protein